MADLIPNIALGRNVELYRRVDTSDPANASLVIVALVVSGDQDAVMKDADTLAAMLGDANIAEATNAGYSRVVYDDTDLVAFAPDDANDRADLDIPDVDFGTPAAGDVWTDVVICYDPDSAVGTDSDLIPMTVHDFAATPDGNSLVGQVATAGFFRAS